MFEYRTVTVSQDWFTTTGRDLDYIFNKIDRAGWQVWSFTTVKAPFLREKVVINVKRGL